MLPAGNCPSARCLRAEVEQHAVDTGEQVELLRTQGRGQQGSSQVLVDHRVDTLDTATRPSAHRDAAAARRQHHVPRLEQGADGAELHDTGRCR
jgi:hypothetical protein